MIVKWVTCFAEIGLPLTAVGDVTIQEGSLEQAFLSLVAPSTYSGSRLTGETGSATTLVGDKRV